MKGSLKLPLLMVFGMMVGLMSHQIGASYELLGMGMENNIPLEDADSYSEDEPS